MEFLNLYILALAMIILASSAAVVFKLQYPKRKTYAYALAKGLPTDPDQLGFEAQERRYVFADGSTTLGWEIVGKSPGGPVVIISHGWNSSRYGSLLRVPVLAPFASRLIVYDLRGHGESTAPISCLGTLEADDLLRVVEQIEGTDAPVVLYGVSLGAGVSIVAAANADEATVRRITAVIADGPFRYFGEPLRGHLRCRKVPAFPIAHLSAAYAWLRLPGLAQYDRAAYAARLACPLLVLHGTDDPICRFESGQQIAAVAPRGRLVAFEGGSHGDLIATDNPLYVQSLESLFNELAQAPSPQTAHPGQHTSPTQAL